MDFLQSNKDTSRAACCSYLLYILRIEIHQKSIKKILGRSPEIEEPWMARLFFIAAQEIKQIILNLGARPRNSGSLGAALKNLWNLWNLCEYEP